MENINNEVYQNTLNVSENNNEKFHKPILAMLSFTTSLVCRKVSVWVTLAIFSVIALLLTIAPVFFEWETRIYTMSIFIGISSTFFALSSGLQGTLTGISTFKDTQVDGVELIILSKPITRNQVLISRFIFLISYALLVSIVNLLLVVIGTAIVGFEYYSNLTAVIGGTIGGSLLAFLAMAMIAIAISLKLSSKASVAIPSTILGLSTVISMMLSTTGTMLIPGPINGIQEKIEKQSTDIAKNSNLIFYNENVSHENGETKYYYNEIKINSISAEYNSFFDFTLIQDNKLIYWSSYIDEEIIKLINTIISSSDKNLDGIYATFNEEHVMFNYSNYNYLSYYDIKNEIDSMQEGKEKQANKQLLERLTNIILSQINGASASASGLTALSYLNPISAFSCISGSGSNAFNSNSYQNLVAYNYSAEMKEMWNSRNFFKVETQQQDPSWGVFLMWLGIVVALGFLVVFDYKRKDFQ